MRKIKYVCDCGYQTEHNGAFNLHKYHCNLRKGILPEKKEPKKSECDHSFRLLIRASEVERNAINHGYKEVCEKCQTLR